MPRAMMRDVLLHLLQPKLIFVDGDLLLIQQGVRIVELVLVVVH